MKITSPAFADKIPVPLQYTCKGQNQSPPFEFLDVPKETKSLALIIEDIDSPNHRIHWLVYNIPGNVTHFDEGKIPEGAINGICNDGNIGYQGPCPRDFTGVHHFCFRLYALDTLLQIPSTADMKAVQAGMEGHILAKAEMVGVEEGEGVPLANE
jgi:Raf kinase inhibitor-like YbhB/YbcL family protein